MKNSTLLSLTLVTISAPLHAVVIFEQDFESGLGANESVSGAFSINSVHPTLNNGTMMMGHSGAYGPVGGGLTPLPSYSHYDLTVDLTGFTGAQLTFDFNGGIEKDFDGFNLLGTTGVISAPNGLLTPTPGSGLQYGSLVIHGASSPEIGPLAWSSPADPSVVVLGLKAVYDLSAFDNQVVNLRFQFGSDALEGGDGASFDNIVISTIPEPSTSLLGAFALGLVCFGRRRS